MTSGTRFNGGALRELFTRLSRVKSASLRGEFRWISEATGKEIACFLGATVTALRGRGFATTTARPRKAVTVAPESNALEKLQQINFSDSRSVRQPDDLGQWSVAKSSATMVQCHEQLTLLAI